MKRPVRVVSALARTACFLSVASCAAIAGLQDPPAADSELEGDPPRNRDAGTTGNNTTTDATTVAPEQDSAPPDAAVADTGTDAGPPVPTCKNPGGAPNGDSCTQPSQCCNAACNELKACADKCAATDDRCDVDDNAACCVGAYCSRIVQIDLKNHCKLCLPAGASAEKLVIAIAASCCSRNVDIGTGKCL